MRLKMQIKMKVALMLLIIVAAFGGSSLSASSVSDELKGAPKLMVTDVQISTGTLMAGKEAILTVTIRNTNGSRYIKNAVFTFSEASNEIVPAASDSVFVGKIAKGSTYVWSIPIRSIPAARSGIHTATIDMAYEDNQHIPHTMSSKIVLEVRQPVRLHADEPRFPARVTQGETPTLSINLMNLGKSNLFNVRLSFDVRGLANSGSALIGTIGAGESKQGNANFHVASDVVGPVEGIVTLAYEDDVGKLYEEKIALKTTIEEKTVPTLPVVQPKSSPLLSMIKQYAVWFWLAGGLLIVLGLTIVAFGIKKRRQRRLDEAKL